MLHFLYYKNTKIFHPVLRIDLRNWSFRPFCKNTQKPFHINSLSKLCKKTSIRSLSCARFYSDASVLDVFDRKAKRIHRDWCATLPNGNVFDYLKEEVGDRVADRVFDITRKFSVCVELGCGKGHVTKHFTEENVGMILQCDTSRKMLVFPYFIKKNLKLQVYAKNFIGLIFTSSFKHFTSHETTTISEVIPTCKVVVDEEFLPFPNDSIDLFISSLSFHWINNLPGTFQQIIDCLKPDGVLIASMFGGDTLFQLRSSLQLAETEREGGFSPHISPFARVRDIGDLMNRAGYTMLTIDTDEITVNYPSMFELLDDLRGMAESNAAWNRKVNLGRDMLLAAAAIYSSNASVYIAKQKLA